MSHASVCEKPMNALDAAKMPTPSRKTLRRPKMSPSRPPVMSSTPSDSVYALTVHSSVA